MTLRTSMRFLLAPVDAVLTVIVVVMGLLVVVVQALSARTSRSSRDPRRILSIATAQIFVPVGDDIGGFSTYYVYPGARRSVAVFFDGVHEERFVGRSRADLLGLTLVNRTPTLIRKLLPFTGNAFQEVMAVARIIFLVKRLNIGTVATFAPSRMTPRALTATILLRSKFIVKVFGNQALLAHIKSGQEPMWIESVSDWMKAVANTIFAQILYRRADLVIGYNINNAASAISLGAHPAKTRMLRIRPHAATFSIVPASGRLNNQIVLWSRLAPEKAVFEACSAAIKVMERNPQTTLHVIGDGPDRQRMENLVRASNAANRVVFHGWMQRDELFCLINGSAVALVPLGGYALLEAAMIGIPVVCFDIEWHNEVISQGVSGYLADYPNTDHMADLVEDLINNPEKAARFAIAARSRVEAIFEPEQRKKDEIRIMRAFFQEAEKHF